MAPGEHKPPLRTNVLDPFYNMKTTQGDLKMCRFEFFIVKSKFNEKNDFGAELRGPSVTMGLI